MHNIDVNMCASNKGGDVGGVIAYILIGYYVLFIDIVHQILLRLLGKKSNKTQHINIEYPLPSVPNWIRQRTLLEKLLLNFLYPFGLLLSIT